MQEARYNGIRYISLELGNREMERAKSRVVQTETKSKQILTIFLAAGAFALLVSILAVFALNSLISTPLKEIAGVAERIASGDLSVHISPTERRDEIGVLSKSFSNMTVYLRELADMAARVASATSPLR